MNKLFWVKDKYQIYNRGLLIYNDKEVIIKVLRSDWGDFIKIIKEVFNNIQIKEVKGIITKNNKGGLN